MFYLDDININMVYLDDINIDIIMIDSNRSIIIS